MTRPSSIYSRAVWVELAKRYKNFCRTPITDVEIGHAWSRLVSLHSVHWLGAVLDGRLIGFAQYLFHASAWTSRVCYLQDMFIAPDSKRRGAGRALIRAEAAVELTNGADNCYWLTHVSNAAARRLYDSLGRCDGILSYDYGEAHG